MKLLKDMKGFCHRFTQIYAELHGFGAKTAETQRLIKNGVYTN